MRVPCPSCGTVSETIIAGWKSRSSVRDETSRALIDAGLPRLADWVSCRACGFDGPPHFDTESCIAFVHALEREGGTLAQRRDYGGAIVRFIRTLAVLPDYTPSVAAVACVLIDAAAACGPDEAALRAGNLQKADSLLWMAIAELPALPCIDLLLGRLESEQGRAESARRWFVRYMLSQPERVRPEYHRVADYPHDAIEEARFLLYELPQLYRPCVKLRDGGWSWTPWRETPQLRAA